MNTDRESPPNRDVPPVNPDARIQGGSIRLFRVAGIDVMLHWSWFFFAVLRLQSTGADDPYELAHYDSTVWFAVEYLALFGFVLLHEFGHVLACRSVGGIANRIVLWPLGGLALIEPPARPGALLWSVAAGPLVNAVLLVPTVGFWMACRAAGYEETAPDVYRLAGALAWINGYLLAFNLLPVYPLDGGRMLQALLWYVMDRARSLLVASAVGLVTGLGLVIGAIVERSLVWGIMAGLGVLFSLVGLLSARAMIRMLRAPRRPGAACPACGAAAPTGNFWPCLRCSVPFDAFAAGGNCPNCSTALAAVLCPECGLSRPYRAWQPAGIPSAAPAMPAEPVAIQSAASTTVTQRVVWSTVFAVLALALCGFPSAENQPWGLIVWTVGGAILGATSAGALTRGWRKNVALRKLNGTWCLVEEDGHEIVDGPPEARQLILKGLAYEQRVGSQRTERGACWINPSAEPPAISFTPKAGPDAGQPRPGIYRLEGKELTVCVAYPGQPRPTAFVAQTAVQHVRRYQSYRRGRKAGD